jgi:hypothetical protein
MAKTHDIGPFFWQVIEVKKGTPPVHRAQTQEIDGKHRNARPFVIRLPFVGRHYLNPYPSYDAPTWIDATVRRGLVVGFWHETGYEEYEALTRALNLNNERADEITTDFETSIQGARNGSTDLAVRDVPGPGDGAGAGDDARADGS